ncbi:MAG: ABC transporter ATP-binding protein, partial [Bacillota bacterium]|nr:ABC transporter ATP-binding protein [Bacillota bacterium]
MKMNLYKAFVVALTVILSILNVMFAFVLKVVIDSTYTGDVEVLKRYLLFSFLFIVVDIVIMILLNLIKGKYLCYRLIQIKNDYYAASLSNKNTALVSDLTAKIEQVYVGNLFQKFKILGNVVEFVVALGSIIYISWTMTLGIALVTMIPIMVPALFSGPVSRRKQQYLESTEKYVDLLKDTVTGMDTIRSFSLQNIFLTHHRKQNDETEIARMKSEVTTDIVDATSQNLGFLTFLTALGIGAYYVITGGMTFGTLIAAVQLMNSLMQPLSNISSSLNKMNGVKEVVEELTRVRVDRDALQTRHVEQIEKIEVRDLSYSVEVR